mgnify:CR=1 FL=1
MMKENKKVGGNYLGGSDSSSIKFIMICFLIRGVVCRLCATPTKIEEMALS